MFALTNLRKTLSDLDYKANPRDKAVVFIPVLSLAAAICQFSKTLPLPKSDNPKEIHTQSKKFLVICKWHLRGSMIQLLVSAAALENFAIPAFLFLASLAVCELIYVGKKVINNRVTLIQFEDDGKTPKVIEDIAVLSYWNRL